MTLKWQWSAEPEVRPAKARSRSFLSCFLSLHLLGARVSAAASLSVSPLGVRHTGRASKMFASNEVELYLRRAERRECQVAEIRGWQHFNTFSPDCQEKAAAVFPNAHVPERLGTERLPHSLARCCLPTDDRTHDTMKGSWGFKEGHIGERWGPRAVLSSWHPRSRAIFWFRVIRRFPPQTHHPPY